MIKISNFPLRNAWRRLWREASKFQISNSHRGFSFIELILYVSILVTMLSAMIPFAWDVIGSSTKSATQQEVNTQARYVSERIKYEIRNANSITSINNTSCTNNSIEINTATNPVTVIDISGGKIRIRYGAGGAPVNLNSNNTSVSCLTFTDYRSGDNKTNNVQFRFTLDAVFNSQDQKYNASTTIESAAEIRNN